MRAHVRVWVCAVEQLLIPGPEKVSPCIESFRSLIFPIKLRSTVKKTRKRRKNFFNPPKPKPTRRVREREKLHSSEIMTQIKSVHVISRAASRLWPFQFSFTFMPKTSMFIIQLNPVSLFASKADLKIQSKPFGESWIVAEPTQWEFRKAIAHIPSIAVSPLSNAFRISAELCLAATINSNYKSWSVRRRAMWHWGDVGHSDCAKLQSAESLIGSLTLPRRAWCAIMN